MSDPDTMYFHQTMRENDVTEFLKAMHKGFLEFPSKGVFKLIYHSIVPEGDNLFPAVWAMKKNDGYRQGISTSISLD